MFNNLLNLYFEKGETGPLIPLPGCAGEMRRQQKKLANAIFVDGVDSIFHQFADSVSLAFEIMVVCMRVASKFGLNLDLHVIDEFEVGFQKPIIRILMPFIKSLNLVFLIKFSMN